jgi:hypothetical protein
LDSLRQTPAEILLGGEEQPDVINPVSFLGNSTDDKIVWKLFPDRSVESSEHTATTATTTVSSTVSQANVDEDPKRENVRLFVILFNSHPFVHENTQTRSFSERRSSEVRHIHNNKEK